MMFQAMPNDERFGLYFDRVKGLDIPLVTGALGASTHTYAAVQLKAIGSGEAERLGGTLHVKQLGALVLYAVHEWRRRLHQEQIGRGRHEQPFQQQRTLLAWVHPIFGRALVENHRHPVVHFVE
jgi:hypothetical protein